MAGYHIIVVFAVLTAAGVDLSDRVWCRSAQGPKEQGGTSTFPTTIIKNRRGAFLIEERMFSVQEGGVGKPGCAAAERESTAIDSCGEGVCLEDSEKPAVEWQLKVPHCSILPARQIN